jgi:hemoglobin-like flavoprotein
MRPQNKETRMTSDQKALVKTTWKMMAPTADTAAGRFYERLFEIDLSTRSLFQSSDMAEQRRKLVQALALVVQGIDDLAKLAPAIADLGRRHAQLGVIESQYESVGSALLWTLEQSLGSNWTIEARLAWTNAYALVAGLMKQADAK